MRLLICTQALDSQDSNLGFFVEWVREFAKHCESVSVICLREGVHDLPANVKIYSLGKEKNNARLGRWVKALRYIVVLRQQYDAVFVHMNPEYVVLGGWLWRLWGKKIALWYTHKSVDLKLRVAAFFADSILTASKESFRLPSKKVHVMGHGIDTDFFSPDPSIVRGDWVLSVGRLSSSKRHDLAIRAAVLAGKGLRIAGEGPEHTALETLARQLGTPVIFLGGLTHEQLRDEYRRAAYLLHTSETGSLDKVTLEALASGLPIRTNDVALKVLETADTAHVRTHHSLNSLIPKILAALQS